MWTDSLEHKRVGCSLGRYEEDTLEKKRTFVVVFSVISAHGSADVETWRRGGVEQRPLDGFLLRMKTKVATGTRSMRNNHLTHTIKSPGGHFLPVFWAIPTEVWGITPGIWTDLCWGLSLYDQRAGHQQHPKKKQVKRKRTKDEARVPGEWRHGGKGPL